VKKVVIIAIVAALVLAFAPLALAMPGHHHGKGPVKFTVSGTITAVSTGDGTVTIKVASGSKGLRKLRGQELTLTLTDTVKIVRYTDGGKNVIAIGDLKVGEKVRAWGMIDRSDPNNVKYMTSRLMVRSTWPFACQGTVDTVDTTPGAMTLTVNVTRACASVKKFVNGKLTVSVLDTTKIVKVAGTTVTPITLADIQNGDKVLVIGRVDNLDPSAQIYKARFILVKGA
jgi:hypothetical protein